MPDPVRTRRGFDALGASRARGRSGPLWVVRAPVESASGPARSEIAYAIGRHVGTAVVRNRLRRRLRALMRVRIDGDLAPARYLIGTRPGADELTFEELGHHLDRALAALP